MQTNPDLLSRAAWLFVCIPFGLFFASLAYHEAKSPQHPGGQYAAPAQRVILWIIAIGFLAGGAIGFVNQTAGIVLLLVCALLGFASQTVLWLSLIVAPRWAARVWYHQQLVAIACWQHKPVPTLTDAEREARRAGYGLIGLIAFIWLAYWLTTRWLGIFILPVLYGIGLAIGIVMVYTHHPFWVRRIRSTIRSER